MANVFIAPHITADILPDPNATSAGLGVTSETPARIGNLSNWLMAEAGAEEAIISQSWEDDICSWNGAVTQVCLWRIPTLSDAHLNLDIQILAKASAGLGTVHITSSLGGGSVSTAIPNMASTWYEMSINTGAIGAASYNDLGMSLAVTGGDVVVLCVVIRYRGLPSPLPAGLITLPYQSTQMTPMGATSLPPDRPLTASRGHELCDTLGGIAKRPRVLNSWSGLSNIQPYKARAGAHWMWDQSVSEWHRCHSWGEARAEDVFFVLHAYTNETIGADRIVKWAEGQITTVLNGTSGWITLTWRARDVDRISAEWGFPLIFDDVTACPMITIEQGAGGTFIIAPVTTFTYWEVII